MNINTNWTILKTFVDDRQLSLQYIEEEFKYIIFAIDTVIIYITYLWKDTTKVYGIDIDQNNIDINDFETNYKGTANQGIEKWNYKDGKGIRIIGKTNVTAINQTILKYTVPANTILYITDIIVGGDIKDLKLLRKTSGKLWRAYHQDYDSMPHPFETPLKVSAGEIIKVINKKATTGNHIATIIGVKINA